MREFVVVGFVSGGRHAASKLTRNWGRSKAVTARIYAGAIIALTANFFALSSLRAQMCHEDKTGGTHVSSTATAEAAAKQHSMHAGHSHGVQQESRPQEQASPAAQEQTIGSPADCCCPNGQGSSCPPSCPGSGACSGHGPVTSFSGSEHLPTPAPVSAPELCVVRARPDSWSGSLDTPPPRN